MKGGRLYSLVLLLATISALQCIPIEVVYSGDSCDCPKYLNYMVNVPPPRKEKSSSISEHGYKLDVPMQAKAKVTYTFDFTVQEPKTPSPIEQEKWDLYAKIDRITAHKKDCIAEEGSPSNTCSCHRCKASRRYVSPQVRGFTSQCFHPNSLSKTQRPASAIAWAALFKPMDRRILADETRYPNLKTRRRRDLSRIFLRTRKPQPKKQSVSTVKQYNKSLLPSVPSIKPLGLDIFSGQRPFEQLRNFMRLPRLRNKRDIKGEYDLIEKERDEIDLTLPEIIQFMPETLDPNFKRGQCQFGDCPQETQIEEEEAKNAPEEDSGNTLDSVDKEVKTQGDDDKADKEEDKENDINSSHAKRNAADFNYEPSAYNPPVPAALPYAPPYQSLSAPPAYKTSDILARPYPVTVGPYGADPVPQQYVGHPHAYQIPPPYASPRAMYAAPPYMGVPYYTAPLPPPPPPPAMYNQNYQLDSVIADIINRHSDFIEASSHEGGALVDSKSEQKHQNKALFKTIMGGKWQRFVIDDYYGAPKYRREELADQPNTK